MDLKLNATRLLVVDDFEIFRRFVCLTLKQTGKFQIIGQASDGLEAVRKAAGLQPDLILLDIGLPKLDGIESARQIRQLSPGSKILFLSNESDPEVVRRVLDAGALGYVQKVRAQDDLVPAVTAVLEGKRFVSSSVEVPVFDIFSGMEDSNAVWVETIAELSKARERMEAIAERNRAHYFVISRVDHSIVARANDLILKPKLGSFNASTITVAVRIEKIISTRARAVCAFLLAFALLFVWIAFRPATVSRPTFYIPRPLPFGPSPDASRKTSDSVLPAEVPRSRTQPSSRNSEYVAGIRTAARTLKSGEVTPVSIPTISSFPNPAKPSGRVSQLVAPTLPPLVAEGAGFEAFPISAALLMPRILAAPPIRSEIAGPNFVRDRTFQAHSSWTTGVAFSADGQRLASGSWDKTVRFWDVSTGQELGTVAGKVKEVQTLAFSPDGHWLAAENSMNTVVLWDATTAKQLRSFPSNRPVGIPGSTWVYSIAFSPDSRWLASAIDDETVRIWDVRTGEKVRDLRGLRRSVMYAAFSPSGRWLASGDGDKGIEIWDVSTGQVVQRLKGHKKPVYALAFSPNGRWLASASADKTVKLWDLASGQDARTLVGHTALVTSVVFSADGRWLASGSWDKTIKIWNVETGSEVQTLKGDDHSIYTIAFDSSGRWLASGTEDGTVNLWLNEAKDQTSGSDSDTPMRSPIGSARGTATLDPLLARKFSLPLR